MSLATPHVSFRFADSDIAGLNRIVSYQRSRVGNIWQEQDINRTSVLRVLIQLECNRIEEEEDKEREKMEKTMAEARRLLDVMDQEKHVAEMLDAPPSSKTETARERKTRLQRARRAAAAAKKGGKS